MTAQERIDILRNHKVRFKIETKGGKFFITLHDTGLTTAARSLDKLMEKIFRKMEHEAPTIQTYSRPDV